MQGLLGQDKGALGALLLLGIHPNISRRRLAGSEAEALAKAREVAKAFVQHAHPRASDSETDAYPVAVR
jgi:hypothetical protein